MFLISGRFLPCHGLNILFVIEKRHPNRAHETRCANEKDMYKTNNNNNKNKLKF